MGISIYLLCAEIVAGRVHYAPGVAAAVVLFLSLAAKLYMSFAPKVTNITDEQKENASKAQLNVAEYEDLFLAIFLFLCIQERNSLQVTIISCWTPLAQAIYFWGCVLTGKAKPWVPIGALSRYACMVLGIYVLYVAVAYPTSSSDRASGFLSRHRAS